MIEEYLDGRLRDWVAVLHMTSSAELCSGQNNLFDNYLVNGLGLDHQIGTEEA